MDKTPAQKFPGAFSTYRIIRIDGNFDPSKVNDLNDIIERAVYKVLHDANAHRHTIEDGILIASITDCGESA